MRGFEPAAGLLRERIRHAGEKRGFAVARLLTHWAEIVGDEIAAHARPVRIAYGRAKPGAAPDKGQAGDERLGASLTLLASGAMAPVIQMQIPAIRERVNACYGYHAISRIVVTQTSSDQPPDFAARPAFPAVGPGFAEAAAPFGPAGGSRRPAAPELAARAEAAAEGITDPGLRAALEMLAGNVLNRRAVAHAALSGDTHADAPVFTGPDGAT